MTLQGILLFIICIIACLFGAVHAIAARTSILQSGSTPTKTLLMIGGTLNVIAVTQFTYWKSLSITLWIIGSLLTCGAAYWNGKHSENFHPMHHVIRATIAIVILLGAIFL